MVLKSINKAQGEQGYTIDLVDAPTTLRLETTCI